MMTGQGLHDQIVAAGIVGPGDTNLLAFCTAIVTYIQANAQAIIPIGEVTVNVTGSAAAVNNPAPLPLNIT